MKTGTVMKRYGMIGGRSRVTASVFALPEYQIKSQVKSSGKTEDIDRS